MSTMISTNFGELGIVITQQHIRKIQEAAIHFTLRKTHPLTFQGPYLAIHPIAFTDADRNLLFDVFDVDRHKFDAIIKKTTSINRSFVVTSDSYNLLIFWLCHLAPMFINDKKVLHEFCLNLLRLFHYKIFCSTVNNSFRHGANEGVMLATVDDLTKKSDVIKYGSWSKLIDVHCEKILNKEDRFYHVIMDASPDEAFLSVIAENQTALRQKVVTYAVAYYEAHTRGDSVQSRSSVAENAEGEKILMQTASVIESATQSMVSEILNPNMFVHDNYVESVANEFGNISARMLKTALLKINETAVLQTSSRSFDKVIKDKEGHLYIGVRSLMIEIIRSMIKICRMKRVNMGSRALVFQTMRDSFSSSRNTDKDILAVKRSVAYLVDGFNITTNTASQAALRLAVISYVLYRTIDKMK